MDVIHDRVAGLDVHKDTVVACVRAMSGNRAMRECRTYATTTEGLLALLEWLNSEECGLAAMEATGVYWLPVWKILSQGEFELILANAAHIKAVPGRKTDLNDAMWIADLAAHGLIKASFVPDEEMHDLRTLTRTRKQLVREQTRHVQRIQKTLTEANIRLDSVLSDIMGLSGRRMIEAMIAGVRDARKLAALAGRGVKATPKELYDALHGRLTDHHRFLLKLHLGQWDALQASIRVIDREVDARVARMDTEARADEARFSDAISQLASIPGVRKVSALGILSEIGTDMSRFETDGRLLGRACVPARTRAPGSARARDCARAPPGSRPCSSNAPGRPSGRRTATPGRSSTACKPDAARKRRSAPSLPPSCAPSTTCSRTEPSTRTSAPTPSTADPPIRKSSASPVKSPSSAITSYSNRQRKLHKIPRQRP
jgi:transposase